MNALEKKEDDIAAVGERMHRFIAELYPLCRSITGEGLRETLRRLRARIPLEIHEVPTGTQVLDWTIPREWNIRAAWLKGPTGEKVVDFARSNLHVVNYSVPVRTRLPLAELRPHLHTLPEHPDWIPYRTSYYKEDWGFCLPHRQLEAMPEGEYEVHIDSRLEDGALTYGELLLPGEQADEVLFSCHVCHPSLCNDNLSGLALAASLAQALGESPRRYSYRFLFLPGTIGAIAWLARNRERVDRIRHGLVVACVGDPGKFHYKRSRRGDADIDRAVVLALRHHPAGFEARDFSPFGYDERQYCSPGFDLPVGSLTRTPHGRFPEYHTSADDLDLVRPQALAESLAAYRSVVEILENDGRYLNLFPHGEPQLGKRGLYRALGGLPDPGRLQMALLWVLNQSDGRHSLVDIAQRADLPFPAVHQAAEILREHGLLRRAEETP